MIKIDIKIKLIKTLLIMMAFASVIMLYSCQGVIFENNKRAVATELKKEESMIFVCEEKNKYMNKFNNGIWQLKSGDGKLYFKDYVLNVSKQIVEYIMKFKLIAKELNINLTTIDKRALDNQAILYYEKLTDADKEYMGVTFEDCKEAFYDYHIARLVVDRLSKTAVNEISISEAKVIRVQYIIFDNEEKAIETREKLNVPNANFAYFAKNRSIDNENIEMIVKRGDETASKFPELFRLSKGEITNVIKSYSNYYIFKCIDDYLVDETEERRIEILKTMKNDAFNLNFAKYQTIEYKIQSEAPYWRTIDLEKGENCTIDGFYDLYYEVFPKTIK